MALILRDAPEAALKIVDLSREMYHRTPSYPGIRP